MKPAEYYGAMGDPSSALEEVYHSFLSRDLERATESLAKNLPKIIDAGLWLSLHQIAQELLAKIGDERIRGWLIYLEAICSQDSSLTSKESLDLLGQALILAEKYADSLLLARAHLALGQALQDLGETRKAERHYTLSLKFSKDTRQHLSIRANVTQSLAELWFAREEFTRALGSYIRAERAQRRLGNERNALLARSRMALINYYIGQPETSLVILDEMRERVFATSNHTLRTSWHMVATFALFALGRLKDALKQSSEWVDAPKLTNYPGYTREALCFRAILLTLLGEAKEAEKCLTQARRLNGKPDKHNQGFMEMAYAALLTLKG
ncbi:hypothetical protein B9Q03_04290 [Candidatus Marsarchaeota G2 archaeon OSP_D]|uniref:Uncharacterized protein n=1 Tax=Candidatus Marsarchaeota G2 archaeon OSP_D TaxID=1978157 RepID=A0A2R6AYK3_9ARCH|nr:MAG: hypothetical protein B9Q03_04290 [Candidatus Marsarchaeota G2 archaeon OSP_D]